MSHYSSLNTQGLSVLIDLIVPGNRNLPAARDLTDFDRWMRRALEANNEMALTVVRFADMASGRDSLSIDELQAYDPAGAEEVVFVISCAYFMSPTVQDLLRYPGQGRKPIAAATPDQLLTDDLLQPVMDRGPIYVPAPP